jgi:hypothetical protein
MQQWLSLALQVQLAATLALCGLIWMVQLVHYPLLARVGAEQFRAYHREHARRITWVVAPLMLAEAAASSLLLLARPSAVPLWAVWTGWLLVAAIWLSTGLLQVPCHARLTHGFEARTQRRLVASNWLRTLAWTARGALVLWMSSL